jgi:hypothetical protein
MSITYAYNSRTKDDLVECKINSLDHFEKIKGQQIYYHNPVETNDLLYIERTRHSDICITYKCQRPEHKVMQDFETYIKNQINTLEVGHVYLMDARERSLLLNLTKKSYYPLSFKSTFPPKHSDILCIAKDEKDKALIVNFVYPDLAFSYYFMNNIIPLLGFYDGHTITDDFLAFIGEHYKRTLTYQKTFLLSAIPSCWPRLSEDVEIFGLEEKPIENRLSTLVNVKLSQLMSKEIEIKGIKSAEIELDMEFPLKDKMRFVRIQDGELNFYPVKDVKNVDEVLKHFGGDFSLKFIYFS